ADRPAAHARRHRHVMADRGGTAGRAGSRPRLQPEGAAPRRAGIGRGRQRDRAVLPPAAGAGRRGRGCRARRARRAARDVRLRRDLRARLRTRDREGHAGRDPVGRGRPHRLPGRDGGVDMTLAAEATTTDRVSTPLLELRDIRAAYDGINVLRGVDLVVPEATVVAVLGPNGAGKTTT